MLDSLRDAVLSCRRCPLHKNVVGNKNPQVFSDGPEDARVMLIGQNPGRDEVLQGKPFVGAAGKKLNAAIEEAGLKREDFYISNAVKCFTMGNADPDPQYQESCRPYLLEEIRTIRPAVILLLGRSAHRSFSSLEDIHEDKTELNTPSIGPVTMTTFRREHVSLQPYSVPACENGNLCETCFGLVSFTIHPAYTIYNPESFPILVKSLKVAKAISQKL